MPKPSGETKRVGSNIRSLYGGTFDPPHYGHLYPLLAVADALALPHVELLPAHVPAFKSHATLVEHRLAMTKLLATLDPKLSVNTIELERSETSYTVNTLQLLKQSAPHDKFIFIIGSDSLLNIHKWKNWRELFDYCDLLVLLRPEEHASTQNQNMNASGKHKANTLSKQSDMLSTLPKNQTLALNLYDFHTTSLIFDDLLSSKMDEVSKAFLTSKLARVEDVEPCSINDCCMDIAFTDIIANSVSGKLWLVNNQQIAVSSTFVKMQLAQGGNVDKWVPPNILEYIKQHHLYL